MAGAVIAGLLLAGLHGTLALEIAVIILLFAALFVQRRRYGLGVTFLTPLIVLLLATSTGDPWIDSDVVGAVKQSLIVTLNKHEDPAALKKRGFEKPYYTVAYDFTLPRTMRKAA